MIDYDTFPLKRFFKLLKDDSLLESEGVSKEDWEAIKEEWGERHPTQDFKKIIEAHKKVMVEGFRLKRDMALFQLLLMKGGDVREFYDAAGITYHEDAVARVEHLNAQIGKSKKKLEIYESQRGVLEEEIKDRKKIEENTADTDTIININKVLASFEIAGISITSYEDITLGRYDGLNEAFEERARKQNNG